MTWYSIQIQEEGLAIAPVHRSEEDLVVVAAHLLLEYKMLDFSYPTYGGSVERGLYGADYLCKIIGYSEGVKVNRFVALTESGFTLDLDAIADNLLAFYQRYAYNQIFLDDYAKDDSKIDWEDMEISAQKHSDSNFLLTSKMLSEEQELSTM